MTDDRELGLDHVGLSVASLDAAGRFYSEAFQFAHEFAFDLPRGIRGLMMRHPSGARVELFQRPDSEPGLRAANPIEALATRGYGHLALAASEIDSVFRRALAAGARAVVEPGPSPEPGVRFAFLADPEGNLVELVERRA
jgi:catechol 2,3-dioxygenase-like lactoylglutathione lyase family enzyme